MCAPVPRLCFFRRKLCTSELVDFSFAGLTEGLPISVISLDFKCQRCPETEISVPELEYKDKNVGDL